MQRDKQVLTFTPKSVVIIALFWGSLWGLTEATLGYLVHLITAIPGMAGFFMFPIAFYFMTRAYKERGQAGTIFATAAVAASLKLVDLLLPGLNPLKTINPAISILMEAMAVIFVIRSMKVDRVEKVDRVKQAGMIRFRFRDAILAGLYWRGGFIGLSLLWAILSLADNPWETGILNITRFLILETMVNAVIIVACVKISLSVRSKQQPLLNLQSNLVTALVLSLITIVLHLGTTIF